MENRIKQVREKKKMTQTELADAAKVSRTMLNLVENGKANASLGFMNKIAKALGCSVKKLLI